MTSSPIANVSSAREPEDLVTREREGSGVAVAVAVVVVVVAVCVVVAFAASGRRVVLGAREFPDTPGGFEGPLGSRKGTAGAEASAGIGSVAGSPDGILRSVGAAEGTAGTEPPAGTALSGAALRLPLLRVGGCGAIAGSTATGSVGPRCLLCRVVLRCRSCARVVSGSPPLPRGGDCVRDGSAGGSLLAVVVVLLAAAFVLVPLGGGFGSPWLLRVVVSGDTMGRLPVSVAVTSILVIGCDDEDCDEDCGDARDGARDKGGNDPFRLRGRSVFFRICTDRRLRWHLSSPWWALQWGNLPLVHSEHSDASMSQM